MLLKDYMLHYEISRADVVSDPAIKVKEKLEKIFGIENITDMRDDYNKIDVIGSLTWVMYEYLVSYRRRTPIVNIKSVLKGLRA